MDARCRIELLGGLRLIQGERTITRFRTQKNGALLAYLAYHLHRDHPREELIELLWPECDLDAGRNRLSTALSTLRPQLEPPGVPAGAVLRADRLMVRLNPAVVAPADARTALGARRDRAPRGPGCRPPKLSQELGLRPVLRGRRSPLLPRLHGNGRNAGTGNRP